MRTFVGGVLLVVLTTALVAQDSLLPTLEALRLAYPANWTHADRGAYLNAVAFRHKDQGWGLLAKPTGNRCSTPQGVDVSCDYLVYRPTMQGFDVLADETTPVWQAGDIFTSEPERWVAPVSTGGPVPVPDPQPPPPPVYDLAAIQKLLDDQRVKIDTTILPQLARIEEKVNEVGTSMKEAFAWIGKFLAGPVGAALITWLVTRDDTPTGEQ
jgi:hypothetical protein